MQAFTFRSRIARWRLPFAALVLGAGVAGLVTHPSWASDHADAPSLETDPGPDITDVYAFMRPGSTTHMVLAMNVSPGATAATPFDHTIDYTFRILGYSDATGALDPTVDTKVICRFEAPADSGKQLVLCAGNGSSAFGTVGVLELGDAGDGGDAGATSAPMRIFAGLRADPAFGDIAALKSTLAKRQLDFAEAGVNSFAGKNVLAIVVEVDVDKVLLAGIDLSGGRPKLAISASTERIPQ